MGTQAFPSRLAKQTQFLTATLSKTDQKISSTHICNLRMKAPSMNTVSLDIHKASNNSPAFLGNLDQPIIVGDQNLTIDEVVRVARHGALVSLTDDQNVLQGVQASRDFISNAVETGLPIYGVTSGFGGMANVAISPECASLLQNNLVWFLKSGAGKKLPLADVRAAMLLRINSHLYGASGIRLELIQRMEKFLNAGVTPHVYEFGSIGASGDLVPLSYITGALIGLDPSYTVDFNGQEMDAPTALKKLDLEPLQLLPKEGLAMMNGTSVMTAIAANCVYDTKNLLALAMGTHALAIQGLNGTNQSFHPFIHQLKPHPGQKWAASQMLDLLAGSRLVRDELDGSHDYRGTHLIQDRYSLRCLPQYMGPIVDGIEQIQQQIEIELNSATDNPLIDAQNQASYHGGNFLGQYVGTGMDQLRYYIGLLAKHLDVQIASLVAPEFNNGLSPSLVGNRERSVNMGLKGLQIAGNSIMPLLTFYGNSIADRFPTHAEQFNQNINSQGFASANLARQSVEIFQQYMAIALMFGVQAVDLRTYAVAEHYDARACLSPATKDLYIAVRDVVGQPPSSDRPYIWNDHEQGLDQHIALIAADIAAEGQIVAAVNNLFAN
ncbi:HAL/PAL/TAL family ammonia-lyase [Nodularia sp. NIES-3585]|uniref:HAL/PAL/TAL family ammonia-lyase n=1 Tax=Nodularia sp. NIES-3585 TaxID=1973477 RepID=UPI000B63D39F|nr:aromatic amino acid ammonia-lyase [Nodularia sp. NIES-3585]GAX38424.1 histidine ammonia-lyase [Nodularia sp. NIES-3585]